MHQDNDFLTLTYDDAHVPSDGSLHHGHFQRFMKRFRKSIAPKRIKFFMCGEYGDELSRPHYHALVFGYEFGGRSLWKRNAQGDPIWSSAELTSLWPYGMSTAQAVNFQTAAYCARYVTKKITGKPSETHYAHHDPETGQVTQKQPEYATQSNGLGKQWANTYDTDLYPSDFIVIQGRRCPIPSYYDRLKDKVSPEALERVKRARIRRAARHVSNNTPERLRVRETVLRSKLTKLSRPLDENGGESSAT